MPEQERGAPRQGGGGGEDLEADGDDKGVGGDAAPRRAVEGGVEEAEEEGEPVAAVEEGEVLLGAEGVAEEAQRPDAFSLVEGAVWLGAWVWVVIGDC